MSDSKASPFSTGGSAASRGSQPIATNARGIQGTTATTESARNSAAGELVLENKLGDALSPYVRRHATNPVHWQQWCPETLQLAKKHNRVLFVSIGYAACHWCHVMERESFENDEIAKLLNDNFIPVKVDREERPDIDRIYMNFVEATTGSGGWPLNVFLTPDLKPVFGGTYWPGPESVSTADFAVTFQSVLEKVATTWEEQPTKFLASAEEILLRLEEFTDEGLKGTGDDEEETLDLDLLEEAFTQFNQRYDPVHGGFGLPPKFPLPVKLALLLRMGVFPETVRDIIGKQECLIAQEMAITTLVNMARGGIHDQIGRGFSRYSVTADWSLPHFEKMLYDNAQLLGVYLDAYLVTGDSYLLETAISTADYLCDDALRNPAGGFYSSEGADSLYRKTDTEKREGAFYVWTRREFDIILGEQESSICAAYWNVHSDGNVATEDDQHDEFLDQNCLMVSTSIEQLSETYGMSKEQINTILQEGRRKLLEHRNKERPRPSLDNKIITSWNGLAIATLSRAAAVLQSIDPTRSKNCVDSAKAAAAFIRKNLYDESTRRLKRAFRETPGTGPAFADDYAYMIHGLLSLYEATFDASFLKWAVTLQESMIDLFLDTELGGFFVSEKSMNDLILRLKDGLDSQEPSTNGIAADNLYRLSSMLGDQRYAKYAWRTCTAFSAEILEHPSMFASHMTSIVSANMGMRSIVIVGKEEDAEVQAQLKTLRSKLLTNTTVVHIYPGIENTAEGKWLLDTNSTLKAQLDAYKDKPMAQVCQGQKCLNAFDMSELEKALKR
ncbi:hypothetical protein BZA77DRAFT_276632 [Pyronema omphalodes]|nr:hypothetical protein BZA77DRAFT_276632 [Pyronema omphalodes]